MTKEEAFDALSEYMASLRCSDHYCMFKPKYARVGMGTNGGCQTAKMNHQEMRITLHKMCAFWNKLEDEVHNE